MEHHVSAASLANPIEDDGDDGFIEGGDDLLRIVPHELANLPPALLANTRRQQELGGGPARAFARCGDPGCSACRSPCCGELEESRGLDRLCLLCHHGNPLLCLLRLPCLSWAFDRINQFRQAQEALTAVGNVAHLTTPPREDHPLPPEADDVEQVLEGAVGGEGTQHHEGKVLEEKMVEVLGRQGGYGEEENFSGITPRLEPSPTQRYQDSPEPTYFGHVPGLRRSDQQEDLSQLYGADRLRRKEEPLPTSPPIHQATEGERIMGHHFGPRLASTPVRQVGFQLGPGLVGSGPPQGGWLGAKVQQPPLPGNLPHPPRPLLSTPHQQSVAAGRQEQQPQRRSKSHTQDFKWQPHRPPVGHPPIPPDRLPPPQPAQARPPPPGSRMASERPTGADQEATIARNQEKIVDFLQLMTDKLMQGQIGGERPPPGQLRLPNLTLPLPRKSPAGRIETKEYHLWRISLEKTILNNKLNEDAVLALLANNVKLTTDEWLATFQSSATLQMALQRLDTMHAPIQHLYGQLIRQLTESTPLHGATTKERIHLLNLMIQYIEEFIIFFGASTDLTRENILIILAKIADSKEARDMSLRNIYTFDEAFRRGTPYSQSLKDHLVEARLLAVDLESALDSIADADHKRGGNIRTAAVAVEEQQQSTPNMRRGDRRKPKAGGNSVGNAARPPRPPAHCHQCDTAGHMSYMCPDLKKIKRGEMKLRATLCKKCIGLVASDTPHQPDCAVKRIFQDGAYLLLRFTCDHNIHVKICNNQACAEAKTRKILDSNQNPTPSPKREASYAARVISLASSSQPSSSPSAVAFLKEITALRGRDGMSIKCVIYYDSMASRSFVRFKQGCLPANLDWGPGPNQQTFSITTISGEQIVEKQVFNLRLITVHGLENITAVEGGLEGEQEGSQLDPGVAAAHNIDAPTLGQLNEPQVVLIVGSDVGHLMPRVKSPPRRLKRQYPGLMLADSVVSNRQLYFGPVHPQAWGGAGGGGWPRMAQA